ncbi:MAG: hypothetical protein IID45_13050 [Planctomycetes bacterium]|nr:hypothetical protein [Planctomycetota bacterium]
MATLTGILATAALAHLTGHLTGGILARFSLIGFGRKLPLARHVFNVGKALRKLLNRNPTPKAREDLQRWLKENDPNNDSKLGDGVV